MERVQKILAMAGVASRRKAELMISQGRVKVNGHKVKLGDTADAMKDAITVDGKPVVLEKKVYFMLNKPKGFVTTVSEEHGMRTVMDIVRVKEKVFPVGRLDKHTEGLLLLTNDGDLANKLTHPKFEVEKEYFVVLDKPMSDFVMEKVQRGVVIDGRRVAVRGFDVVGSSARIRIHEGRKHIVRLFFEELGLHVRRLVRTRIGTLSLGKLQVGKWRELTVQELKALQTKAF